MNDDLVVEAEYFQKAIKAWTNICETLGNGESSAKSTPAIPHMWGKTGSLNEVVDQVNRLADAIESGLLGGGKTITQNIAGALREIAEMYVVAEATNEADIKRLREIIG